RESGPAPRRRRLDAWLVERGLVESREKGQALIMPGRVRVGGLPAGKPGDPVRDDEAIEVLPGPEHVGRGAVKLVGALAALGLDPAGCGAVDGGVSAAGLTVS